MGDVDGEGGASISSETAPSQDASMNGQRRKQKKSKFSRPEKRSCSLSRTELILLDEERLRWRMPSVSSWNKVLLRFSARGAEEKMNSLRKSCKG